MTRPWSPKHTVPESLARALIEAQFDELAPIRIEPFGVGWDNTAFLVNETFVFRFPRRQIAVEFLEAEIRVLPHIAGRLPLPIGAIPPLICRSHTGFCRPPPATCSAKPTARSATQPGDSRGFARWYTRRPS